MYKVHQDATLLPTDVESPEYVPTQPLSGVSGTVGSTKPLQAIPQISSSASRDANGKVHVSIVNLHHDQPADVAVELRGATITLATGRIVTAPEQNSHNTFEQPNTVVTTTFNGTRIQGNELAVQLPPRSVVTLQLT